MRPLRRHRRFALLALIAFAAQIILAFGHMHHGAPPPHAGLAGAYTAMHAPDSPTHPAEHDPFCLVCWAINAAGSLIFTQPVALIVPMASAEAPAPPILLAPAALNAHAPFQARAPPRLS